MIFLERAAKCGKNIIILGEQGTGKEETARKVHELSPRCRDPFVALNCAKLPDDLVEAEIFGYASGSFEGAIRGKGGLLETAGEGTFFLDEVAELSLQIQPKLLQAIDQKKSRRIGEKLRRPFSCRFIFATSKNLQTEINAGKFHRDLYFRINALSLWMPPLRERPEDIPLLIHYFLEGENQRRRVKKDISPEALRKLMSYDFPGNIRELRSIIERTFVLSKEKIIREADLHMEDGAGSLQKKNGVMPGCLKGSLGGCCTNLPEAKNDIPSSRHYFHGGLEESEIDVCLRRVVFL